MIVWGKIKRVLKVLTKYLLGSCLFFSIANTQTIQILNFYKNTGFDHGASRTSAVNLVESLATKNGWTVVSTENTDQFTDANLKKYDAVVWSNNCVIGGVALNDTEKKAYEDYLKAGGSHVGIHCGGAVWGSGTADNPDWKFFKDEVMAGAIVIGHPPGTPQATLHIENKNHRSCKHLNKTWVVNDEWYHYTANPRAKATVLFRIDESTYDQAGTPQMGDHPVAWYHSNLGGRIFFTGMGHTTAIYNDQDFQNHIEGGIKWAVRDTTNPGTNNPSAFVVGDTNIAMEGLILDLDANKGVTINSSDQVLNWVNQSPYSIARDFNTTTTRTDAGRPDLLTNVTALHGGSTISFREEDLVNMQEDAFDHLNLGSGYTWISVLSPYDQIFENSTDDLQDVNSFFGNLKNTAGYEGIWGGFDDDETIWIGTRKNIVTRWNADNPKVEWNTPLQANQYYIVAGRMGAGLGPVDIELFVGDVTPKHTLPYTIDQNNDASKMAVGTERDATNHPGKESFDGEIARLLIYDRPLSNLELQTTINGLNESHLQVPIGLKEKYKPEININMPREVRVYDMQGNIIKAWVEVGFKHVANQLEGYPQGTYVLKIIQGEISVTRSVIHLGGNKGL